MPARGAVALPPLGPRPEVTLALYVKNAVRTVERAVESALAQSWGATEVVVIDGASTDGTLAALERHRARFAAFVSRPDCGAFEAANRAIGLSRAPIVGFVMGDDWLEPRAAEAVARAFAAQPQAGIVSVGARIVEEAADGGFRTVLERPGCANGLTLDNLLGVPLSAARFFRREVLDALGGFSGRFPFAHDRDLLMRAWLAGVEDATVNDILYTYRRHAGSRTLGGDRAVVRCFLEEHRVMSAAWLARPGLDAHVRRAIRAWRRDQAAAAALMDLKDGPRWRGLAALAADPPAALRILARRMS